MDILSIQSRVAYGYVGNAAAVPALQRLGHRVWPVETTMLSNHLGYATHGGRILQAEEVSGVLEALARLGLFGRLDALLTGFLGAARGYKHFRQVVLRDGQGLAVDPGSRLAGGELFKDRDRMPERPVGAGPTPGSLQLAEVAEQRGLLAERFRGAGGLIFETQHGESASVGGFGLIGLVRGCQMGSQGVQTAAQLDLVVDVGRKLSCQPLADLERFLIARLGCALLRGFVSSAEVSQVAGQVVAIARRIGKLLDQRRTQVARLLQFSDRPFGPPVLQQQAAQVMPAFGQVQAYLDVPWLFGGQVRVQRDSPAEDVLGLGGPALLFQKAAQVGAGARQFPTELGPVGKVLSEMSPMR